MKFDRRIPIDLHPDVLSERANAAARKEFDSAGIPLPELGEDPVLQGAQQAAGALYHGLTELYRRLDTVDSDTTRTSGEKTRLKGAIRDKHSGSPAKRVTEAQKALRAATEAIDRRINEALRSRLEYGEAKEVRDFVRQKSDRMGFLLTAAKEGDTATLAAVLSHKAYLSGITDKQQQQLRDHCIKLLFPEETAQRARYVAAAEMLSDNGAQYIGQVTRMVNAHEAARLERERQATEDALSKPLGVKHGEEAEEGEAGEGGAAA